MTEKENESSLHIISTFSFCNTFSFFLAVLYFASPIKESTNKKNPKMHFAHPKILTKVNLAPLSALHEALLPPFIVVTFKNLYED